MNNSDLSCFESIEFLRDRLQFDDITGTTLLPIKSICDDRENGIDPPRDFQSISIVFLQRFSSDIRSMLDQSVRCTKRIFGISNCIRSFE